MESNDSPDIPDRGGDIRHPRSSVWEYVLIHTQKEKTIAAYILQLYCKLKEQESCLLFTRLSVTILQAGYVSTLLTRPDGVLKVVILT